MVNGDNLIESLSVIDENDGTYTSTYNSQGVGDVYIKAECGSLVTETFSIEDIPLYDDASSDKSQHFGQSVILRNSGNIEVNYDNNNHNYILSRTASGDGLLPIPSITGLNDFTMEFDAQVNYGDGLGIGVCVYSSSSNWGAMGTNNRMWTVGTKINGAYDYTAPSCSLSTNVWYHFKATITNNTLKVEIYDGNTLKCTQTKTYSSSWFGETTQYGFNYMWQSGKPVPIKNIKVKSL